LALLGIDFGTAHVRVVTVPPDGEPRASDVVVAPAIVAFGPSGLSAGDPVLMTAGTGKEIAVSGIKRLLGREASDPVVKAAAERRGLRASALDEDLVLEPEDGAGGQGPKLRLIEGVAECLRYTAEQATGKPGDHEAVIAVPSWFGEPQRDALAKAARGAQIKVLRFVRDTVATAMWLVLAHGERGKLAVVDVGAGGMSCSLATATDRTLRVELSRGDATLGGDDVDAELVGAATMTGDPQTWESRRRACEAIKRALAAQDRAEQELSLGGKPTTISVERWELDLLMSGVVAVVQDQCHQLLDQTGWRSSDLDLVVTTGGMTLLPAVAERVETSLGRKPEGAPEGLNVVALGAALQAAIATLQAEGIELIDGEKRPREEVSTPDQAAGRGAALSGTVTTTRKEPVRFRPAVTQSRRNPSLRPSRTSRPPEGASGRSAPPPPQSPTPSPVIAGTGSTPAPSAPPPSPSVPPSRSSAPPSTPPPPSPPAAGSNSPSATSEPPTDDQQAAPTSSSPPDEGSAPPQTLRSQDSVVVSDATDLDANRARRRAAAARFTSSPPGSRSSRPAGASALPRPTGGKIVGPRTAGDVLGMPLSRPLSPGDLNPIYLPVLFRRVLAGRDTQGQVVITAPSYEMEFTLSGGSAALTKADHSKLVQAFDLPAAEWKLAGADKVDRNSEFHPLARVALAGVRRILRTLRADELEEAFGERLDLAAQVRPDRLAVPKRLGLGRRDLRFLDRYVDGAASARTAAHEGGLGPSTALQLLALLDLYDVLDWEEAAGGDTGSDRARGDDLAQVASKLDRANHFEVLQVHWSATDRELEERAKERLAEFGEDSAAARVAPEACAQLRSRIEKAYGVLKDPTDRVAYRNEVYGDIDFEAARDLAATRSAALSMRGDAIEARKDELAAQELARSIPAKAERKHSTRPKSERPGSADDDDDSG